MLKNYFKTAWRNLFYSKAYSIIAILGLAIGLAVSILIFWGVNDELSYDTSWPDANSIYRINATIKMGENTYDTWTGVPAPLTAAALKTIPGVDKAVRYSSNPQLLVTDGNQHLFEKKSAFTEPSFFNMFHVKFLRGNANSTFNSMYNIVLSKDAAIKYFGSINHVIGKMLLIGEKQQPYTVSAVMDNMPEKSSIHMDMLLSLDIIRKNFGGNGNWKTIDEDWGNYNFKSFLKLSPGANVKTVEKMLTAMEIKNNAYVKPGDVSFILQPLNTLRLYSPDMKPDGMRVVQIFFLIGLLILLIAIINYVNLSTARATKRAKEVGLRRVVGANRRQLLWQFIIEFILVFLAAVFIALFLLLPAIIPIYKSISGKYYTINYWQLSTLKVIALVTVATIVLASLYPAWVLSSFSPIQVLKSNFNKNVKGNLLRKSLVVLQFSFSIFLIICTLIISRQLHYIQTNSLGFNKDNIFTVNLNKKTGKHYDLIAQQLRANPAVTDVAYGDDNILDMSSSTDNIKWPGKNPSIDSHITPMSVSANFTRLMELQFAQGSGFTDTPADSGYYLINESALKEMDLKNPVGTIISLWDKPGVIKGVLKDFHNRSFKAAIPPTIFRIADPQWGGVMYVKTTTKNDPQSIAVTKKALTSIDNVEPFEYQFLDDDFDTIYRQEMQTATLFKFFAAIAIILSCLGLFGLSIFTAERKVKEIGVRKVLGASVGQVTALLSRDFVKLILIAIIIASPIAWWAMHNWLQNYQYRITISWWIFLMAGLVAILIALITVSFQAIKAALANPVNSLRSE